MYTCISFYVYNSNTWDFMRTCQLSSMCQCQISLDFVHEIVSSTHGIISWCHHFLLRHGSGTGLSFARLWPKWRLKKPLFNHKFHLS